MTRPPRRPLRPRRPTAAPASVLLLGLVALSGPAGAAAQDAAAPPFLSPGDHDFSGTPFEALEYEVRWVTRPGTPRSDTGFVYMRFAPALSEQRPAVRATWLPYFGDLGNMDLMVLDAATYGVRYRLEPRAGGGMGIYWYEDGRSHAAQVDSTGAGTTASMALERPVFSVPTLPWVLAQLSGRIDQPVRLELPGYDPEDGGRLSVAVLTPGERRRMTPPEGGGSHPVREMTLDFEAGHRWRYFVSDLPPYFLGITAWNAEGVETSRIRVVAWAPPAFSLERRIPQIMRQGYIQR